jgi:plasmid stabilization system protein ParE
LRTIRYHTAAEAELLNEITYFETQSPGLGRRFFGEIQQAEKLLAQFPALGREVRPGVRRQTLRKFQFSLIYSIEPDDSLLILAVAHHRRRPGYWISRLEEV